MEKIYDQAKSLQNLISEGEFKKKRQKFTRYFYQFAGLFIIVMVFFSNPMAKKVCIYF